MSCPNDGVKCHYYRVRQDSELGQAITSYHTKSADFIQHAANLVKKYEADSAHMLLGFRRIVVDGLHYTDEKAPLKNWSMDGLGHFKPHTQSAIAKDFAYALPCFERHYPKAGLALRASMLGATLIATLPDHGNGIPTLADGTHLDKENLYALLETATEAQKEHISTIGRITWLPLPLFKHPVFEPSDKIKKLNEERGNFRGSFKYSLKGRYLQRSLQNLAMALNL